MLKCACISNLEVLTCSVNRVYCQLITIMAELASTILAIAGGIDVLARTSFASSKLIRQWRDAPASVTSLAEEVEYLHDATIRLKSFAAELQLRECYAGEKGEKHGRNCPYITVLRDLVRRVEPFLEQLGGVVCDLERYSRRQTLSLKWMRVTGESTC
ncbi:uncharacterized protein BDV14DRAFT_143313 [Aspergillus stella-maris]|uniref:uncharacterized protein n=1 Tax=Aspergillus stella-maris TaxID=1810926 RepID=UPI003CCD2B35